MWFAGVLEVRSHIRLAVIFVITLGILVVLWRGCDSTGPRVPRRLECLDRLRQVGLAMANYASENQDRLPPAYIADKNGRPLLSWRVLLLPYVNEKKLFDEFRLDEPWNSEHNRMLSEKIPKIYRCPTSKSDTTFTSYLVITGKGMIFDQANSLTMQDIAEGDGTTQTILLVESADSGITWTEPRDLPFETMNLEIGKEPSGFSSPHSHGANAVFCDGHCRFLSARDPSIVHALCTPRGGENIGDDF